MRLLVPDLFEIVLNYLDRKAAAPPGDPTPAEAFLRTLGAFKSYHEPLRRRLIYAFSNGHIHKWFYDYDSLAALLTQNGFCNVERKNPFESAIQDIDQLERASKKERKGIICVEAVKGEAAAPKRGPQ